MISKKHASSYCMEAYIVRCSQSSLPEPKSIVRPVKVGQRCITLVASTEMLVGRFPLGFYTSGDRRGLIRKVESRETQYFDLTDPTIHHV